jgi:hypothetical protein
MRGATRAHRDDGGAAAGEAGKAGDARDRGGVEGLPVAHGRPDDGSMAGLTCFVRRIEEAHICAPVHAVLRLVSLCS